TTRPSYAPRTGRSPELHPRPVIAGQGFTVSSQRRVTTRPYRQWNPSPPPLDRPWMAHVEWHDFAFCRSPPAPRERGIRLPTARLIGRLWSTVNEHLQVGGDVASGSHATANGATLPRCPTRPP